MKASIILTDDGSSTIYLPELDETYHSKFGAVGEAQHVFIENGIAKVPKNAIHVLEIGFGTGLNALLTLLYAQKNELNIHYTALEKFPLKKEVINALNYSQKVKGAIEVFPKIHQAEWGSSDEIEKGFVLKKIHDDVLNESCLFPEATDLIFFDAFAPSNQVALWDEGLFKRLNTCLNEKGCLVTYSSAGMVKRALRNAGFKVKRLPGPPGKHHMLFCSKQ